uniref:WH2 domain-containing protein n=1 Tax=Panagrolaimus superbus TaxID=310955 RepID=A0A914YDF0_9BILA
MKPLNEDHKVEPQEIVEAVEKQFYVAPNEHQIIDEQSVEPQTYRVEDSEEQKLIVNPSEPKSLQDELMEANHGMDFGDSEHQIIIDNELVHDNTSNNIVEQIEAEQPLLQPEEVLESVKEHYKHIESEGAHEGRSESDSQKQKSHDTTDNISYSIDDAISGLANLQLHTPQKDVDVVIEQNFVDFGADTPVAESNPPQFDQDLTQIDSLDLSPLKKDDGFSGSEEKLQDTNKESNGNETSRVESPDQGPFSSSSSTKESDAENTDIILMPNDKKEKPPERKARLSEILAKARQGMSISPPTAASPTNNGTSNSENNSQTAVDAKLLALKLIEQRRQEKLATGIENDTTVSSDNISESEPTITATNNKTNGNGPRLSLAEELAVANTQQTKPMDILPGQPIYDSDYKILNGKTTPPEDPSHVQLV